MNVPVNPSALQKLKALNVEVFGQSRTLPASACFEPPCALKHSHVEGSLVMGAFSYAAVSYTHLTLPTKRIV